MKINLVNNTEKIKQLYKNPFDLISDKDKNLIRSSVSLTTIKYNMEDLDKKIRVVELIARTIVVTMIILFMMIIVMT